MGSHDPARKKRRFRVAKRRVRPKPASPLCVAGAWDSTQPMPPAGLANKSETVLGKLKPMLPLLWEDDYEPLLNAEADTSRCRSTYGAHGHAGTLCNR